MRTTVELNNEINRHRKLLNRAVRDKILPHINYHHYVIVQLIDELEEVKRNTITDIDVNLTDLDLEIKKQKLAERQAALKYTQDLIFKINRFK